MWIPVAALAGIGMISGLGLAVAARVFAVETDPRRDEIADLLPGANCGGCGYAGCNDFAAGIVRGDTTPVDCPVCDDRTARLVGAVMGLEVNAREPQVALIMCQGGDDVAGRKYQYNGLASCSSANLIGGGDKTCGYGCLGLGDCQDVCTFGAVEMTEAGIARIIPARCTACGLCVTACPKDIIKLIPKHAKIHVLCANHGKGASVKKACSVACLGCKKCEKAFADDPRIVVSDFLAAVDYDSAPTDPGLVDVCPTGAIVHLDLETPEH